MALDGRPGALPRITLGVRMPPPPPPPTFSDAFTVIASPRGRAGDLDPSKWSAAHYRHHEKQIIRPSTIPASIQTGFGSTSVYPPNDVLYSNTGSHSGHLMLSTCIQNYGNTSFMIRQPFDFNARTGKVIWHTDLNAINLGWYACFSLTADPAPAPTFMIASNDEPGPLARQGLILPFRYGSAGPPVTMNIYNAFTYDAYIGTELTSPTTALTGASAINKLAGSLNRLEFRISQTFVELYASDYSLDGGVTFPNQRLVWAHVVSLPFTRGYIHLQLRNHASVKYNGDSLQNGVFWWDNVSFDGPYIAPPRAYEIPDNTDQYSTNTEFVPDSSATVTVQELGYQIEQGTSARVTEGLWNHDPDTYIGAVSFSQNLDLTGITSAKLTFTLSSLTPFYSVDTTMGIKYRFNGGTWRTRLFTTDECTGINDSGGAAGMVVDVLVADLTSGSNNVNFSAVGLHMGYPPNVANIDLLLS